MTELGFKNIWIRERGGIIRKKREDEIPFSSTYYTLGAALVLAVSLVHHMTSVAGITSHFYM